MAPFELLLLSALVAGSVAAPASVPAYRGYNSIPSVASPNALQWFQNNLQAGQQSPISGYKCFHGDIRSYPGVGDWLSFEALWNVNEPQILHSNDGDTYIEHYIKEAVLQVAGESQVNARLILAAVMQESSGKASVNCTGSTHNCGLMRASYGSHSFDPSNAPASILTMIREGVQGTTSGGPTGCGGPGYAQYLNGDLSWVMNSKLGNPYAAARAYNSGVVGDDLDNAKLGTANYANDIANRLLGWDGTGQGFKACS